MRASPDFFLVLCFSTIRTYSVQAVASRGWYRFCFMKWLKVRSECLRNFDAADQLWTGF